MNRSSFSLPQRRLLRVSALALFNLIFVRRAATAMKLCMFAKQERAQTPKRASAIGQCGRL